MTKIIPQGFLQKISKGDTFGNPNNIEGAEDFVLSEDYVEKSVSIRAVVFSNLRVLLETSLKLQ